MAAVTSIMRAQQILLARVDEELRPFELTLARFELLMLLHFSREGALPMGTIGRRLQVHPTSVTSAVDRLERQELVRREPHPTDRRTKLVSLTDAGRDRVLAAVEVLNGSVFADPGLPEGRTEELVALLGQLRGRADGF
ncbi:MarR family transcriptional regulator [Nitriliruptoraceae bacterium ZYF776]|nr:MarR family transcriptional regulator [Profundirhabdus halotolerans]